MENLTKSQAYGHVYSSFDAASEVTDSLSGFMIRHGAIVDGLQPVYNGKLATPRGGTGGSPSEVKLADGDYITEAIVAVGNFAGGTVISGLTFKTANGRTYGPYGDNYGNRYSIKVPDGSLIAGIFGSVYGGRYLSQLGFYFKQLDKMPDISKKEGMGEMGDAFSKLKF